MDDSNLPKRAIDISRGALRCERCDGEVKELQTAAQDAGLLVEFVRLK